MLHNINIVSLIEYCLVHLAVTQDGKLYACGEATNGRLGLGNSGNVQIPRPLTSISQYVIKKVAVHSGLYLRVI